MNPLSLATGGGAVTASSSATGETGDQFSSNAFNFNSGSPQTNSLPMVAILAGALVVVAVLLRR